MRDRDPALAPTHANESHRTNQHVQTARTYTDSCTDVVRYRNSRTAPTLSDLRRGVAREYDCAIRDMGHANTTIADGYLGIGESVVRRLRDGSKPLSIGHLLLGPRDVLARVLVRAVLRAMTATEAMALFATCMADVAKESGR